MRAVEASITETPPTLVFVKKKAPPELTFHDRLAALRKERGLTQQGLAELVGMHISQIRRYESGQSQPTLDAIRKLSVALSVSADMLLFDKDERGPDEDLKLQFEAVSRLDPEEKKVIRSVIESIILRNTMKEAERRFSLSHPGGSNG
jgi:transcriptional regulator with XRE-family HTH domain